MFGVMRCCRSRQCWCSGGSGLPAIDSSCSCAPRSQSHGRRRRPRSAARRRRRTASRGSLARGARAPARAARVTSQRMSQRTPPKSKISPRIGGGVSATDALLRTMLSSSIVAPTRPRSNAASSASVRLRSARSSGLALLSAPSLLRRRTARPTQAPMRPLVIVHHVTASASVQQATPPTTISHSARSSSRSSYRFRSGVMAKAMANSTTIAAARATVRGASVRPRMRIQNFGGSSTNGIRMTPASTAAAVSAVRAVSRSWFRSAIRTRRCP